MQQKAAIKLMQPSEFGGVPWAFLRTEGVEITFREFMARMGVVMFETHCIVQEKSF